MAIQNPIGNEKYDAIRFVMAERLPTDLWNISEKKKGLVAVLTKVNSVPKDIVIPVDVSPVTFIKELANSEGLTSKKVDEIFEQLELQEKSTEETEQ